MAKAAMDLDIIMSNRMPKEDRCDTVIPCLSKLRRTRSRRCLLFVQEDLRPALSSRLKETRILGVDSPFCSTIFLSNRPFSWVSGGFLERRIPGKNGGGTVVP